MYLKHIFFYETREFSKMNGTGAVAGFEFLDKPEPQHWYGRHSASHLNQGNKYENNLFPELFSQYKVKMWNFPCLFLAVEGATSSSIVMALIKQLEGR
jgi:hypothetical protein